MTSRTGRAIMAVINQEAMKRETSVSPGDSRVSTLHFSVETTDVSVLSELFALWDRGDRETWCTQRWLFDDAPAHALPTVPFGRARLRAGRVRLEGAVTT